VAVLLGGQLLQIDLSRLQPRVVQESPGSVDVGACGEIELGAEVTEAVNRDVIRVEVGLDGVALEGSGDRLSGQRLDAGYVATLRRWLRACLRKLA
jgi:hypothetical protein